MSAVSVHDPVRLKAIVMFASSRSWRPSTLSKFSWVSPDSMYTTVPGSELQGMLGAAPSPVDASLASLGPSATDMASDGRLESTVIPASDDGTGALESSPLPQWRVAPAATSERPRATRKRRLAANPELEFVREQLDWFFMVIL